MRERKHTSNAASGSAASVTSSACTVAAASKLLPPLAATVVVKLDGMVRTKHGNSRMWTLEEDTLLLQKRRYHIEREEWSAIGKIQIPGREASGSAATSPVRERMKKLMKTFKSDPKLQETAFLLHLDVYQDNAKAAAAVSKAATSAAVAAAKEAAASITAKAAASKAAAARAAAERTAGVVPSFPWRCATDGAPPLHLSYDQPQSLDREHGPIPFGAAINNSARTAIIPAAWRLQIGAFSPALGASDLPMLAIEDVPPHVKRSIDSPSAPGGRRAYPRRPWRRPWRPPRALSGSRNSLLGRLCPTRR